MERVGDSAARETFGEVAGALEDEGVVTVAVEAVLAAQALVDEDGFAGAVGDLDGGVEGGVLVVADRVMDPAEDEVALRIQVAGVKGVGTLGEVGRERTGEGALDRVGRHGVAGSPGWGGWFRELGGPKEFVGWLLTSRDREGANR